MIDTLRQLWKATPFVPFTLRLKDGRTFLIQNPSRFHHFPGTTEIVVLIRGQVSEHLGVSEIAGVETSTETAAV
jgi:hypothetical protein